MLEAVNVSKAFEGRPVIRDFSARFAPGSRTSVSYTHLTLPTIA